MTVAGRRAARVNALFAALSMVFAVALSYGLCVVDVEVVVVLSGPYCAAAYLKVSLIKLISSADPIRLGQ